MAASSRRSRSPDPPTVVVSPIAALLEMANYDTHVELSTSFTEESVTVMRPQPYTPSPATTARPLPAMPLAPPAAPLPKPARPLPPSPRGSDVGVKSARRSGLEPGDRVGRYQINRKLGQGSFGIVFEALDTNLDRLVAFKVLAPNHAIDPKVVRRFVQEGRAAARVNHPGIVTVIDCGEENGTAYIAMELLGGESLANRLSRSGSLSLIDAMEIGRQVAAALHAAHELGVVHRDLKPDNIFLTPDPATASGERVKVLDFGLAKLRVVHGSGDHTQSNQAFGTPRYMAPEQARSAGDVDRRADIYALGCILFELVCGRSPFEGEMLELFEQHQHIRAPRAHDYVPQIPHGLDTLIACMLEKPPSSRPATMAVVQRELQAAGALSPGASPTIMPSTALQLGAFAAAPSVTAAISAPVKRPLPLTAMHAMRSVVLTPVGMPLHRAPVFGPGTGMIPIPTDPAVFAVALPVVEAPRSRWRMVGRYAASAAVLVMAVALLTSIALGSSALETASLTPPPAAVSPR